MDLEFCSKQLAPFLDEVSSARPRSAIVPLATRYAFRHVRGASTLFKFPSIHPSNQQPHHQRHHQRLLSSFFDFPPWQPVGPVSGSVSPLNSMTRAAGPRFSLTEPPRPGHGEMALEKHQRAMPRQPFLHRQSAACVRMHFSPVYGAGRSTREATENRKNLMQYLCT